MVYNCTCLISAANNESEIEAVLGSDLGFPSSSNVNLPRKSRPKVLDVVKENAVPREGPFPGGPLNNLVLKKFYDHVALRVWYGQVRVPLYIKCVIETWTHIYYLVVKCVLMYCRNVDH